MAKAPRVPPSAEELDKSVEDIIYVMHQCSTHFVWWVHVRPKLVNSARKEAHEKIIQNSIIEATLLFIRKLNEFFKHRPQMDERDDDLRAYDFPGFKDTGDFLHPNDYEQLHKRVGHMTLRQARDGKISWEIHDAVKMAIAKSLPFLDFLTNEFYTQNSEKRNYVLIAKDALKRLAREMDIEKANEEKK